MEITPVDELDKFLSTPAGQDLIGRRLNKPELRTIYQQAIGPLPDESAQGGLLSWMWSDPSDHIDPLDEARRVVIDWNARQMLHHGLPSHEEALQQLGDDERSGLRICSFSEDDVTFLRVLVQNKEAIVKEVEKYDCQGDKASEELCRAVVNILRSGQLRTWQLSDLQVDLARLAKQQPEVVELIRAAVYDPFTLPELITAYKLREELFSALKQDYGPHAASLVRNYLLNVRVDDYHDLNCLREHCALSPQEGAERLLRAAITEMLNVPEATLERMGWTCRSVDERRPRSDDEVKLLVDLCKLAKTPRAQEVLEVILSNYQWPEDRPLNDLLCQRFRDFFPTTVQIYSGEQEIREGESTPIDAMSAAHACLALIPIAEMKPHNLPKEVRQFMSKNERILADLIKKLDDEESQLIARAIIRLFPIGDKITDPGSSLEESWETLDDAEHERIYKGWVDVIAFARQFQQSSGMTTSELVSVLNRLVALYEVSAGKEAASELRASQKKKPGTEGSEEPRLGLIELAKSSRSKHKIRLERMLRAEAVLRLVEAEPMQLPFDTLDGLRHLVMSCQITEKISPERLSQLLTELARTELPSQALYDETLSENLQEALEVCAWASKMGYTLFEGDEQSRGILPAFLATLRELRETKQISILQEPRHMAKLLLNQDAMRDVTPVCQRQDWEVACIKYLGKHKLPGELELSNEALVKAFLDAVGTHAISPAIKHQKYYLKQLLWEGFKLLRDTGQNDLAAFKTACKNYVRLATSDPASNAWNLYDATDRQQASASLIPAKKVDPQILAVEYLKARCDRLCFDTLQHEIETLRARGDDQELVQVISPLIRAKLWAERRPYVSENHERLITLIAQVVGEVRYHEHSSLTDIAELLPGILNSVELMLDRVLNAKDLASCAQELRDIKGSLTRGFVGKEGAKAQRKLREDPLGVLRANFHVLADCLETDSRKRAILFDALCRSFDEFAPQMEQLPAFKQFLAHKLPSYLWAGPFLSGFLKEFSVQQVLGQACSALKQNAEDPTIYQPTTQIEQLVHSNLDQLWTQVLVARTDMTLPKGAPIGGLASAIRSLQGLQLHRGLTQWTVKTLLSAAHIASPSFVAGQLANFAAAFLPKGSPESSKPFVRELVLALLKGTDTRVFARLLCSVINECTRSPAEPIDKKGLLQAIRDVLVELESKQSKVLDRISKDFLLKVLGEK